MKKRLTSVTFLFIFCWLTGTAQTTTIIPKEVRLTKNAIREAAISIDFELDMSNEELNADFWLKEENRPKFSIYYVDQKATECPIRVQPTVSKKGFGFKLTGFNERTLKRFMNGDKDNQIKLVMESDIKISLIKKPGDTEEKFWIIQAEEANKMMNDQLSFTEEERSDFLTALNNFYYYENMVDFGVNPSQQDSTKSDYILSLRFQNTYNKKRFLACNSKSVKNRPRVYWSVDSRLSTNFSDSLNYISFYPVNVLIEKFDSKIPSQLNFKLGNESSQDFANKRVTLDGELNFIIPNLVNLTTAQSNRLRLKPVISFGVKGYYDYSNGIDPFSSGQAYINGHYYIPVFNNYALIIDGGAFYDVSDERNPEKEVQGNYSITLGAEIPKTGFKAMFKFVDGKTDINFKQGSIISIGLLMDFFQEKKKS